MGHTDYKEALSQRDTVLANEYYYKYIFKKTEKIVCSVFYILNTAQNIKANTTVIDELKDGALAVLGVVGDSLQYDNETVQTSLRTLSTKLILLESKLRILHAAGALSTDHLNVFVSEIDSLLRSVRSYIPNPVRSEQRQRPAAPQPNHASATGTARPSGDSRRDRIRAVLQAQDEATIKDISDIITDCSEKTIQRELNDMIKDGVVVRKGERRWSRYSLI